MSNEGALRHRSNRTSDESNESNERPAQTVSSSFPAPDELRLVLLGRTGAGKSATENSILGEDRFDAEMSMSSVTKECRRERGTVEGRKLVLVDTPDFTDSDQTLEEIQSCLTLSSPGPHVFLLVIPIDRYTEEQQRTVDMILEMFNEDIDRHSILIFSHADRLRGESIREFISRQNQKVRDLVKRFGRRFMAFDNTNPTNPEQVSRLLQKVDELLVMNKNRHFTNEGGQKNLLFSFFRKNKFWILGLLVFLLGLVIGFAIAHSVYVPRSEENRREESNAQPNSWISQIFHF